MATINTATKALSNVVVEYTAKGARLRKTFPTVTRARAFYTAQFRAGAEPRIVTATRGIQTEEQTMTVKNTTAAPAKTPKVTKASKTPATEGKSKGQLTAKEVAVLKALSKKALSKPQLWEGFKAGSAVLGAGSKGGEKGLLGKKFIMAEKHDDQRHLLFSITTSGKKALAEALAAK